MNKSLLLPALFLMICNGCSVSKEGFRDFHWGQSFNQCNSIAKNKLRITKDPVSKEYNNEVIYEYTYDNTDKAYLSFIDNKLRKVIYMPVVTTFEIKINGISTGNFDYESFVRLYIDKYGEKFSLQHETTPLETGTTLTKSVYSWITDDSVILANVLSIDGIVRKLSGQYYDSKFLESINADLMMKYKHQNGV